MDLKNNPDTLLHQELAAPYLNIISGLVLLCLLPVGALIGTGSLYTQIFLLHLTLLLGSVALNLVYLIRLTRESSFHTIFQLLLTVLLCITPITLGLMPVTARDALVHHLAVPKWWAEQGLIVPIPWHEWSFYPMLLQLGFVTFLKNGLVQLTPLYHFLYLILLCGLSSQFCYRLTRDRELSYFAFLLPLSLPVCLNLAGTPLVDLALALYSSTALFLLYQWAELKRGVITGIFAFLALGLACDCKYNGFLFSAFSCLFLLIYALREKRSLASLFGLGVLGGLSAFFVTLPWLVKNAIWKSNPFFPMFQTFFGSAQAPLGVKGLNSIEKLQLLYGESWQDILLIPIRMIVSGQDNVPQAFDGVLSPLLLLLFVPLFLKPYRTRALVSYFFLICLSYAYFAIYLSSARIRYMAPIFLPLCMLTLLGVSALGRFRAARFRIPIYCLIFSAHIGFALFYSYGLIKNTQAAAFLSGQISETEYLRSRIPEYPLIEYVNQELGQDQLIYLLLTGNKFYYYRVPVISGGHFSQNTILRWIRFSSDVESLFREFRERSITHILLHNQRTIEAFEQVLNDQEKLRWNDFEKGFLTQVYADRGFSLWKIESKKSAVPASDEEESNEASQGVQGEPVL